MQCTSPSFPQLSLHGASTVSALLDDTQPDAEQVKAQAHAPALTARNTDVTPASALNQGSAFRKGPACKDTSREVKSEWWRA